MQKESGSTSNADHQALAENLAKIAAKSQEILNEFAQNQGQAGSEDIDPLKIGDSFLKLTAAMMADPSSILKAQLSLAKNYMDLWRNMAEKWMGKPVEPVPEPVPKTDKKDRRFNHPDWTDNPLFDYIKQSYLLTADWLKDTVADTHGLSGKDAQKVEFYTKQFIDAMSPSNFLMTNPAALRETIDSKGENLVRGLENMLADFKAGKGKLKIRHTDEAAFEVGVNVATSPGKVIFQNELIQLIQYTPTTKTAYKRPLLIFPPWINKFYILDLTPRNSFIKWMVAKGYTLFVVSWVNPDEKLSQKTFRDYMVDGIMASLDAIELATGENEVTAIGYCIGGTLLEIALSYMAQKGDERIKAATFFTTQVDFSEPGELAVFIDDDQINALEEKMAETGYLDTSEMQITFNMLRANDLIWSYVVNNYLMGKEPYPFDLLYWNSDSTRLPSALHIFYLREMYLHNRLVQPGGITIDDVPIDLRKIEIPVYIQSGREDHIAPYASIFKAKKLYSGPTRFILAGSGHIAGVVNPPAAKKYKYWVNEAQPNDLEQWIDGATEHPGSWWPDWHKWLSRLSGRRVPARQPGDGALKPIEDAPGSYVKIK
ncbi:MAG: class I poly(R)-hydroxyalkanoic acid synthase [Deltaproteobacteria bacterium]|nr:class I poly(R)-hydroxyalkanoic acid synthase [Deltaproteobacteria bacterium]